MDRTLLPAPLGVKNLSVIAGNTEDIVSEILRVYKKYVPQLKEFAQGFQVPCRCPEKVAEKIWYWIKSNIRYQRDPAGVQWIKSPAKTIQDGYGDCKTYSIVTMSILHHLGIKAFFRFASYKPEKPLHHVYVVIPHGEKEIIIDAVWHSFNQQKEPIIKKRDIMPDIYEIAGMDDVAGYDDELIAGIGELNEGSKTEIKNELLIMNDFLKKNSKDETEKKIIQNVVDTWATPLFEEALISAIEQSEMKLFYTTVLRMYRLGSALGKAEIGFIPLGLAVKGGLAAFKFIKNGGLKKLGAFFRQRKERRNLKQQYIRKFGKRRGWRKKFRQWYREQMAQRETVEGYADYDVSGIAGYEPVDIGFLGKLFKNVAGKLFKNVAGKIKERGGLFKGLFKKKLAADGKQRGFLGRFIQNVKSKIKGGNASQQQNGGMWNTIKTGVEQIKTMSQQGNPASLEELNSQQQAQDVVFDRGGKLVEDPALQNQTGNQTEQGSYTTNNTGSGTDTNTGNKNMPLLIGAAVLGLVLLSKKK